MAALLGFKALVRWHFGRWRESYISAIVSGINFKLMEKAEE